MGIDIQLLQAEKGGDINLVKASQKKRFASEALVDDTLSMYKDWVKSELYFTCSRRVWELTACSRVRADAAPEEDEPDPKGDWDEAQGTVPGGFCRLRYAKG